MFHAVNQLTHIFLPIALRISLEIGTRKMNQLRIKSPTFKVQSFT